MNQDVLERERKRLWALCYRMLGVAADADEVVQEALTRALERPPADLSRPLGPWLHRVAMNLARDRLRARRRRGYVGPWLPTPVPDQEIDIPTPEGRYGARESASFAFLTALEALTPTQRAVVVLRDVLDADVAETAETLGTTPGAVNVAHHRARAALAEYDARRTRPPPADEALARFQRLLGAIAAGDLRAARAELADEAVALTDGGGRYHAARVPIAGGEKVARALVNLARQGPPVSRWRFENYNGLPALVAEYDTRAPGLAPRWVMLVDFDADGRIDRLYTVLHDDKLTRAWPGPTAAREG